MLRSPTRDGMLIALLLLTLSLYTEGFQTLLSNRSTNSDLSVHFMSKGLNKARNKQAALKKKLDAAKSINRADQTDDELRRDASKEPSGLTEDEIRQRNDRLRFEELLEKGSAQILNDYSSDGYLNKHQEEEEINAAASGVDRIFEGDPAPEDCFSNLVPLDSASTSGSSLQQQLIPWLSKSVARQAGYLVVVCDPRKQSAELQSSAKSILSEVPDDICSRTIFVNADSPAENRRWRKKSGIPDSKLRIFCDEKMEWMKAYTALGDTRWSMTIFLISEGKVMKLAREVDQYGAARTVRNAVNSLSKGME